MTRIKNNYESRLVLPNGQRIDAGKDNPIDGDAWKRMEDHDVVKAWLLAGIIEVIEDEPAADPTTTKAEKKPAKASAGAKTNKPAPSAPASGDPASAIGEPIAGDAQATNDPAPAAPSWKNPK